MRALLSAGVVAVGFLGSPGLAAEGLPWQFLETPHLYLLFPAGFQPQGEIARAVEGVYTAVCELWLPQGADTQIPTPQSVSEVIRELKERAGLPVEETPPKPVVVLYSDLERLWSDTRKFSVNGLFLGPGVYGEDEWFSTTTIRAFTEHGLEPPLLGCALACCLPMGWKGVLAHELVHVLQVKVYMNNPDIGLDIDLFVEGMARWTEYALGYEGDFGLHVREPVAIWLSLGGELSQVPEFILYEVGATLIEQLSKRLSPPQVLSLFSPSMRILLGLPEEADFTSLFQELYGASWGEFLVGWREWIECTRVTRAAELLYEGWRLGIDLRKAFLRPLLSEEEKEELRIIRRWLWEGKGTEQDLARADEILRLAWAEPTEEVLAALAMREPSLRDWARKTSGPKASAEVSALQLLRLTDPDHPERYVRAFVDAVNSYLIFPGPSPVAIPEG